MTKEKTARGGFFGVNTYKNPFQGGGGLMIVGIKKIFPLFLLHISRPHEGERLSCAGFLFIKK
ncbi:hypothetical protein JYQ79_00080, partial [Anaerobutyricum hallii]|uniref:hypothetical protein n=1 Tax=Anaerobutyricum hallii TaxID=39488 RepID=UPI001ADD6322